MLGAPIAACDFSTGAPVLVPVLVTPLPDPSISPNPMLTVTSATKSLRHRLASRTYVFDNHNQEWQLDPQGLVLVSGAGDEVCAHVRPHDLQHTRLDVLVGDTFDVAIADLLVPDLQRLAADTIQDRQETRLEAVLEHPERI